MDRILVIHETQRQTGNNVFLYSNINWLVKEATEQKQESWAIYPKVVPVASQTAPLRPFGILAQLWINFQERLFLNMMTSQPKTKPITT